MRIAIVDDMEAERKTLLWRLEQLFETRSLHASFYEYKSGADFLSAAKKERFAIAFLDIYMENDNGVDTARRLREFDRACVLVFTTVSTEHALEGFQVYAMQYLVKPYPEAELENLFDEIQHRLPELDPYIELSAPSGLIRLRLRDILYVEHFQHQNHIWTADGRMTVIRQTFREFSQLLSDDRFIPCNRGTIINLEYVEDFDGTDFLLKNGKKIPVSRSLVKTARSSFGDYVFKKARPS